MVRLAVEAEVGIRDRKKNRDEELKAPAQAHKVISVSTRGAELQSHYVERVPPPVRSGSAGAERRHRERRSGTICLKCALSGALTPATQELEKSAGPWQHQPE